MLGILISLQNFMIINEVELIQILFQSLEIDASSTLKMVGQKPCAFTFHSHIYFLIPYTFILFLMTDQKEMRYPYTIKSHHNKFL